MTTTNPEAGHFASEVRARDNDGSLDRTARDQHAVAPDSLTWKYFGDRRSNLLIGRTGTVENMHPQLGQAVSDHSVIFKSLFERVHRSLPPIFDAVYGATPDQTGVKIRNFHKPLTGTVRDGSKYHGTEYRGLDPETFYWAHATFVDMLYSTVERFIKPLSLAEKEQLFQESRHWYSLYAVDATAQPETYLEFKEYWERTVREDLIGHTKVAQYTVGYITKGITRAFPQPKKVPDWLWTRVLAPTINSVVAFLGNGGLDPDLREKLDLDWTDRHERRYQRVCRAVRAVGPVWERFAPLEWRYDERAVSGFRREGIDPRRIHVRRGSGTMSR